MLYLFDKNECLRYDIPTREIASAIQHEELNKLMTLDFSIYIAYAYKLEGIDYVGHTDVNDPNKVQVYKIISSENDDTKVNVQAVHILFDELKSYGYIRDKRPDKVKASAALDVALAGSRWKVGQVDDSPLMSLNFYDLTRLEALSNILSAYNMDLSFNLEIKGNRIVGRYINLQRQRGQDIGKRFVYGSNALEVVRELNTSDICTRIIPRGKGEEKFDKDGKPTSGYGRRIQITDVEWSKAKGDPIDKPKGQEYLELVDMTKKFGFSDGMPRTKVQIFEDIEKPEELIKAGYDFLLNVSRPLVQFKSKVESQQNAELGDIVRIIRWDLDFKYKVRIYKVHRNLIAQSAEIEFGDKLVESPAQRERNLLDGIRAVKDRIEQTETELRGSFIDRINEGIQESMFNQDGYNYELKQGNSYNLPAGYYSFDKPIDENPTKVIYVGAGRLAIADSKKSNGDWDFRTFGTGEGFVADLLVAGTIVGGKVRWNLEDGTFLIGDDVSNYSMYWDGGTLHLRNVDIDLENNEYFLELYNGYSDLVNASSVLSNDVDAYKKRLDNLDSSLSDFAHNVEDFGSDLLEFKTSQKDLSARLDSKLGKDDILNDLGLQKALRGKDGADGKDGSPGKDGKDGLDGDSSYTHIAYMNIDVSGEISSDYEKCRGYDGSVVSKLNNGVYEVSNPTESSSVGHIINHSSTKGIEGFLYIDVENVGDSDFVLYCNGLGFSKDKESESIAIKKGQRVRKIYKVFCRSSYDFVQTNFSNNGAKVSKLSYRINQLRMFRSYPFVDFSFDNHNQDYIGILVDKVKKASDDVLAYEWSSFNINTKEVERKLLEVKSDFKVSQDKISASVSSLSQTTEASFANLRSDLDSKVNDIKVSSKEYLEKNYSNKIQTDNLIKAEVTKVKAEYDGKLDKLQNTIEVNKAEFKMANDSINLSVSKIKDELVDTKNLKRNLIVCSDCWDIRFVSGANSNCDPYVYSDGDLGLRIKNEKASTSYYFYLDLDNPSPASVYTFYGNFYHWSSGIDYLTVAICDKDKKAVSTGYFFRNKKGQVKIKMNSTKENAAKLRIGLTLKDTIGSDEKIYFKPKSIFLVEGDVDNLTWDKTYLLNINKSSENVRDFVKSEIKIQNNNISLMVRKNDIISEINQSAEQIKIRANRLNLESDVHVRGEFWTDYNNGAAGVHIYGNVVQFADERWRNKTFGEIRVAEDVNRTDKFGFIMGHYPTGYQSISYYQSDTKLWHSYISFDRWGITDRREGYHITVHEPIHFKKLVRIEGNLHFDKIRLHPYSDGLGIENYSGNGLLVRDDGSVWILKNKKQYEIVTK